MQASLWSFGAPGFPHSIAPHPDPVQAESVPERPRPSHCDAVCRPPRKIVSCADTEVWPRQNDSASEGKPRKSLSLANMGSLGGTMANEFNAGDCDFMHTNKTI